VVTQTDITGKVNAERQLKTLTKSLKTLAASLIRMRDSERRELQRALQEGVAQVAAVAGWKLAAFPGASDNEILKEAARLIRSCCVDIREMASHLHPTVLGEIGLAGALSDWTKGYQKAVGMSVQLDVAPDLGRMPPALELNVFRIVEESVVGIAMLGARRVIVSVERLLAACRITVESGAQPGLPLGEPGVHLAAIESRAQELGGLLNWGWSVESIHIEVTFPLKARRKANSRRNG
jgi:signal transduction histidine kinase